ncbi:cobalt-precorrin 5A hydrolase [Treponema ruminis]|uniref:Cobalt-precorrin 5A hydrolase n=1 Tax=Treponema ruminis TaxID=744515 RepID=A0A7W8LN24_9SPIR|nr:cobalt-precorrin 5A hydrolase [Treponema ruminis]MBB5227161.1 cobalt-precorrin 5A hydrolase [Treponema ruminis]
MRLHIISFTQAGFSLSERIRDSLSHGDSDEISLAFGGKIADRDLASFAVTLSEWVQSGFHSGNALVFVGAAGIAVRSIAPFVNDKKTDPAVLVIDEKGGFVIPILSGHIGGANELARKIADAIGALPVITTASDVNNLPAIDVFAAKNNLSINDMKLAKDFAAKMLAYKDKNENDRPQFTLSVYIKNDILSLIPKCVILGIGCKKGKSAKELENFVKENLELYKIDYRSLESVNSVDQKKDENALISLANSLKLPFVTFSAEELNKITQKVSHSDFVEKTLGTDNVCERSVFAAGADELVLPKISRDGMTLAVGIRKADLKIPEDLKNFLI